MTESRSANPVVLHFIPQDGIGGAEIAARSATLDLAANVHVHGLFNGPYRGIGAISNAHLSASSARSPWSIRSLRDALGRVKELDPAVLVFSLWRTFPVFVVLKLCRPGCRFVTFVHNVNVSNALDRWLTAIMMRMSDAVWVDSRATFDARLNTAALRNKGRVISLILQRPAVEPKERAVPAFVYWGRLARQKRLDRAIDLFAAVARRHPDARLEIMGPDHGEREGLERQAAGLGIADLVTFHGPQARDAIERAANGASFFLQLSDREGMAMGVVEALQLGLAPIVTPVGEMAAYCRDGINAHIYRDENAAAEWVSAMLADPAGFEAVSRAAIATFADRPTYTEDVVVAARELVGRPAR